MVKKILTDLLTRRKLLFDISILLYPVNYTDLHDVTWLLKLKHQNSY
jgi:hypothetical protein